jgi:transposase
METGRAVPRGKRGGGKRTVVMREVVNGLMYILSTGCQWAALPKDLPPKSTVYDYFDLLREFGGSVDFGFNVGLAGFEESRPYRK